MTVGEAQHIVVIGPMGVGKTTIGGLLADALARPFFDSDQLLEERMGTDGAEIAERDGLERLHALELDMFREMSRHETPSVIAPAASVVDHPSGREVLAKLFTIRLTAPDDVLVARHEVLEHRRALAPDERESLHRRRAPHLERLAKLSFDTGSRSPHQVVADVLGRLQDTVTG